MEIKFVIDGSPVSKKNHSQIVTIGGRPRLIPSKQYRNYEKHFLPQVPLKYRTHMAMPVTLKCLYYMPTKRRVDLCNLINATQDLLVKAGVLSDDNSNIVVSHDGSRVLYDKENPRVEIEIIPTQKLIPTRKECLSMDRDTKVYVITKGHYSDRHICTVTLDKERAQKLQKMYSDSINEAEIEEYIPNEVKPIFMFGVEFIENKFVRFVGDEYESRDEGDIECILDINTDKWHDIVWVKAADEDHALKIAQDKLAEYKFKCRKELL